MCCVQVFSLQALEVFREDEMEALLCGAGEHWSPQQLADSMKFDHGYTSQSVPVRWGCQRDSFIAGYESTVAADL
jgi:E3 ubiquitin-protein ligase TRIP12